MAPLNENSPISVDWDLMQTELTKMVRQYLRNTLDSVTGDLKQYVARLSENMAYYLKLKAEGSSKAATVMRHIRAQANSLVTITTIKEAKRCQAMFWEALKIVLQTAVTITLKAI